MNRTHEVFYRAHNALGEGREGEEREEKEFFDSKATSCSIGG